MVFKVPLESCLGTTGLLFPLGDDLGEFGSNLRSESATCMVNDSDIFPKCCRLHMPTRMFSSEFFSWLRLLLVEY